KVRAWCLPLFHSGLDVRHKRQVIAVVTDGERLPAPGEGVDHQSGASAVGIAYWTGEDAARTRRIGNHQRIRPTRRERGRGRNPERRERRHAGYERRERGGIVRLGREDRRARHTARGIAHLEDERARVTCDGQIHLPQLAAHAGRESLRQHLRRGSADRERERRGSVGNGLRLVYGKAAEAGNTREGTRRLSATRRGESQGQRDRDTAMHGPLQRGTAWQGTGRLFRPRFTYLCDRMKRIACIVLLITPALHAQERLVRHFGPEQGLPAPAVVALAPDRVGFLWIGTASGVYRYDGLGMRRGGPAAPPTPALAPSPAC